MEELRSALESKERVIARLNKEKEALEDEIADLRLSLSRLKKKVKSKTCIRLQLSIPTNTEDEPDLEIVNVDSD